MEGLLISCGLTSFVPKLMTAGLDSIEFFLALTDEELREAATDVGMKHLHIKKLISKRNELAGSSSNDFLSQTKAISQVSSSSNNSSAALALVPSASSSQPTFLPSVALGDSKSNDSVLEQNTVDEPDGAQVVSGSKPQRRRLVGKQSGIVGDALGSNGIRVRSRSRSNRARTHREIQRESSLLSHPWAVKEVRNKKLYPRMYKAVVAALKKGDLPQDKMQVMMADDLVTWNVRLHRLRPESLFGDMDVELIVQLVWEYHLSGKSDSVAFPDVAPIMRVLTPTGIYAGGNGGVCVLGLSGGGTWHGLEFKESFSLVAGGLQHLLGQPSHEYTVEKDGSEVKMFGRSHVTTIKEYSSHNQVSTTRSIDGKPMATYRLENIAQYMQMLLNHFEYEDWRNATEDELEYPAGGFYSKAQKAFRPTDKQMDEMKFNFEQLEARLAEKEHELLTCSTAGSTAVDDGPSHRARRATLQRQINGLSKQRDMAMCELGKQERQRQRVKSEVCEKLQSSKTWNRSNLPQLMRDFDHLDKEWQR